MQSSHLVLVLIDITQSSVHSTEELIVISPHQTELEMLQRENKLIVINKIDLLAKDITHKKIVIKLENGDFVEP
jgi:GTPase involved in cell partitioning and DNA repair